MRRTASTYEARLFAVMLRSVFSVAWALSAQAAEPLVIAASPSLAAPLEALGRAFEAAHPDVTVQLYVDSAVDLRRTIAAMERDPFGRYFIGTGSIHLVAPGDDELIDRLQMRYYVLPGTKTPYAAVRLVLVVPESLADAPASFEALAQDPQLRVAIADPRLTDLGRKTEQLLINLNLKDTLKNRLDVASDARGVLDHLLHGQADVAIVYGPDAVRESSRVRIVAQSVEGLHDPVVHSMAMERFCPDRPLCEQFLAFTRSPDAQAALIRLGYSLPPDGGVVRRR